MNSRYLCALCLAWLFSLELRWWRSCSSAAPMTQKVTVSIYGACACASHSSPPPPLPPIR